MKSVLYTFFDLCLLALCVAWAVYGVEGAGNLYTLWAYFISAVTCFMLIVALFCGEAMFRSPVPKRRKEIIPILSCAQIFLLSWHGKMLVGALILFASCAFWIISQLVKEKVAE